MNFKQTFFWADKNNKNITNLEEFTDTFLERCHLSKMICKYIVLAEVPKILMVLRPYQFWAVEAIIERVRDTNKNGYIWHTSKTKGAFPNKNSLLKLLYLEMKNATKKWNMPMWNWNLTLSQLAIFFEGRFDGYIIDCKSD